jgi:hypothetical protein
VGQNEKQGRKHATLTLALPPELMDNKEGNWHRDEDEDKGETGMVSDLEREEERVLDEDSDGGDESDPHMDTSGDLKGSLNQKSYH